MKDTKHLIARKDTTFFDDVQILRVKFGYLLFLLYLCAKIKYRVLWL